VKKNSQYLAIKLCFISAFHCHGASRPFLEMPRSWLDTKSMSRPTGKDLHKKKGLGARPRQQRSIAVLDFLHPPKGVIKKLYNKSSIPLVETK
jgi:hypothetical protein